jgi:hypothetical protein
MCQIFIKVSGDEEDLVSTILEKRTYYLTINVYKPYQLKVINRPLSTIK